MLRRTLLAAGLAIPVSPRIEDALALPFVPSTPETATQIGQRLRVARRQFDASHITGLMATLPVLLAKARHTAERMDTPQGWAMLSSTYDLATDTLNKVGRKDAARITAERSTHYAARSEDAVAMAASARALGMMLRTGGRPYLAAQVMTRGVDQLEATGLRTTAQAWTYVRLLCARGYTYSFAGDRDRALEGVADADHAVTRLGALLPESAAPFVRLYRMNAHQVLGDTGTALHVGRDLREEMYRTPERRARLHTDLARAWWQWGRPEQTARALLAAHAQAPAEVRERPRIRQIAVELVERYPRAAGVRELATAVGHRMV